MERERETFSINDTAEMATVEILELVNAGQINMVENPDEPEDAGEVFRNTEELGKIISNKAREEVFKGLKEEK